MLGVGWTEMLVIGVVALIVIGPKDLPVVMRQIGRYAGMIRRMGSEFQREVNKVTGLEEVRNLRESITAPLKQTTEEIRREFNAMNANGTAKPSGAIKPADPAAESVVDEIRAAAGLPTPALDTAQPVMVAKEPVKAASVKAASVKAAPVKTKRPAKATPAPTAPVTVTELADVSPKDIPLAVTVQAEPIKTGAVGTGEATKPKPARKPAAKKAPAANAAAAPADKPKAAAKPKAAPKPKAPANAKADEA